MGFFRANGASLYPQQPGMAGGIMPMLRNNSQGLLAAGIGALSGQTAQQQAALMAGGFLNGLRQNQTVAWLQNNNPMLAQAVRAGALTPGDAFKMAYQQRLQAQTPYSSVGKLAADLQSGRITKAEYDSAMQGAANAERWSSQPELFTDESGQYRYGTFSNQGNFRPIDTGEMTPVNPYDMNFQRASGSAAGKAFGEGSNDAPNQIAGAQQTVQQIDQLLADPNLDAAVGSIQGRIPLWMRGQGVNDVSARMDQLQGKAFLEAYQMLKGGGQITEIEGQKAEAAMARLKTTQSDEAYRQALQDFRDAVADGVRKLQARYGVPEGPAAPGKTSPGLDDYKTRYGLE